MLLIKGPHELLGCFFADLPAEQEDGVALDAPVANQGRVGKDVIVYLVPKFKGEAEESRSRLRGHDCGLSHLMEGFPRCARDFGWLLCSDCTMDCDRNLSLQVIIVR